MILSFKRNTILLFGLLTVLFVSCQDSTVEEEQTVDLDMENATDMANEYMSSSSARMGVKIAVTVFRYKNDVVYYATNTDDIKGYRELNEETVTAISKPGQWVFWFAGSGMSELNGIEFSEMVRSTYSIEPYSILGGRLWCLKIPTDVEFEEDSELKYDILYSLRGVDGEPIRLDPKLKINQ